MKVLIIYFSQTGGTEKIAEMVQRGILKSGNNCEIARIKNVNMKRLKAFDLIGIGTPTFFYREPVNVKNFIQKIDIMNGKHCFILSTHGSIIGNTLYYMKEELSERGFLVIGSFDSYSSTSLQFYPKIMHTANHPDEIELEEAEKFGEKICDISSRIKKGESELIPEFELIDTTWWANDSKKATPESLRNFSPKLKINLDKCTKCLACQENCPVNAINVEANPPEIQNEGCIFCWFCEKLCPVGAIEADWSLMKKIVKPNLKKYIEILKQAEREGKFRPYVDYEKIY
ncbi:MAG: EFR1 family ferrodoxin [Candidatus Freyarchaeum deiterrae]